MKRLITIDTETFQEKTVSKKIGKFGVLIARHYKLCSFLTALAVIALTCIIFGNHSLYKQKMFVMQEYADSTATLIEKDELYYAVGFFYLANVQNEPVHDTVMKFIENCNAWFPEYIMAQYVIESASGTSSLAKNANNLYGMKAINQNKSHRPTTQIPGVDWNGYGMYKNWQLSVIDRILWELWRFKDKKPSRDKYLNSFHSYAEDENYIEKVMAIAETYKK